MPRTAVLFGATGLVGRACLDLMLADARYDHVLSIGRREPMRSHPKLIVHRLALDNVEALNALKGRSVDDVFCCLGTTIAKAGSQQVFRQVDLGYVVNAAQFAKHRGARQFLMVTAVGSNSQSPVFYSRTKGEAEEAVAKVGIASVSVFRPSLILGQRDEFRLRERLAKSVANTLSFAMIGPLSKYRPIQATVVAQAMLAVATAQPPGINIYEFEQMVSLAARGKPGSI